MTAATLLALDKAQPARPEVPLSLTLSAGECAMIDTPDPERATRFANLCSGLIAPTSGVVRFLERDWSKLPPEHAAAMRGRIGRVFGREGGWISFIEVSTAVLLPRLHHSRTRLEILRDNAASLARKFGLPGLPLDLPDRISNDDLARAACVRAFLGEPLLLLVEGPVPDDLLPALLDSLTAAMDRGAGAIWLAPGDQIWNDRTVPVSQRYRLQEHGLMSVRSRS
jgi:phospholipid/cholesterol/gamma-HCH transport system ATP-binding protein